MLLKIPQHCHAGSFAIARWLSGGRAIFFKTGGSVQDIVIRITFTCRRPQSHCDITAHNCRNGVLQRCTLLVIEQESHQSIRKLEVCLKLPCIQFLFLALCPFLRQENGPLNEHSTICTHTSHSLHLPDYTEYSRFPPLTDTPTTARQTLTSQDRCYRRWHNRRLICLALRWPWLRLPHLRSVSAASGAKPTIPLACRFTV